MYPTLLLYILHSHCVSIRTCDPCDVESSGIKLWHHCVVRLSSSARWLLTVFMLCAALAK